MGDCGLSFQLWHWVVSSLTRDLVSLMPEVILSVKCYISHRVIIYFKLLFAHLILSNPMDWSPPGSSIHRIFQAGILEWVAIPSSVGSSWSRDRTLVSCISCIAGGFFTTESPGKSCKYNIFLTSRLMWDGIWPENGIIIK